MAALGCFETTNLPSVSVASESLAVVVVIVVVVDLLVASCGRVRSGWVR